MLPGLLASAAGGGLPGMSGGSDASSSSATSGVSGLSGPVVNLYGGGMPNLPAWAWVAIVIAIVVAFAIYKLKR